MKIVVTGSLGNIGKPLTKELAEKGQEVTVISRRPENIPAIEALGAKAAIGTMQDAVFLADTFKGANAVYLMETADRSVFTDPNADVLGITNRIVRNYKQAVLQSGVGRIIHLSGIGAHKKENASNVVLMHYEAEQILKELPGNVSIKFIRAANFYTNLLRSIPTIEAQGAIIQGYGGDAKEPWVSPLDIAAAIAEEMEKPFEGRSVRYVASDEVSPNEIAQTLGNAIGKPDLRWTAIPKEQMMNGMLKAGMNKWVAEGFADLQSAQADGSLYEDYHRNKPTLGRVKLADFAKDFAEAYHHQTNNK